MIDEKSEWISLFSYTYYNLKKQHKIEPYVYYYTKFTHYNCTRAVFTLHTGAFINKKKTVFFYFFLLRERQNDSYSCYMAASFHPATLLFFPIKDHYYVNNSSFWTMPLAKAPTNKVFYLTQSQCSAWCITILFSRPVFFLFFLIWFDFKILYTQTITEIIICFGRFLYYCELCVCFRTSCILQVWRRTSTCGILFQVR